MLDRRTATWGELKERKEVLDAHFLAGRIGENTYLVSLQHLGYRPREAQDELRDLKGMK